MTLQQAIDQLKAFAGVDDATATARVLQAYRELVAESHWRLGQVSIGTTVVGQAEYPIADSVVEITGVKVNGAQYDRISLPEMWDLTAGAGLWGGDGGVFAPSPDAGGVEQVALWPVPGTAGLSIIALAALEPVDPGLSDSFITPLDTHQAIVARAVALGLSLDDEQLQQAQAFDAQFEAAKEKLARRKLSRVGGGPVPIRLVGYGQR